jgi:hypothetical protein
MWREELAAIVASCGDADIAVALLEELEPEVRRTEREWLSRVEAALYAGLTSGDMERALDAAMAVHRYISEGGDEALPAWKRALARARTHRLYTWALVSEARRRGLPLPDPSAPF